MGETDVIVRDQEALESFIKEYETYTAAIVENFTTCSDVISKLIQNGDIAGGSADNLLNCMASINEKMVELETIKTQLTANLNSMIEETAATEKSAMDRLAELLEMNPADYVDYE